MATSLPPQFLYGAQKRHNKKKLAQLNQHKVFQEQYREQEALNHYLFQIYSLHQMIIKAARNTGILVFTENFYFEDVSIRRGYVAPRIEIHVNNHVMTIKPYRARLSQPSYEPLGSMLALNITTEKRVIDGNFLFINDALWPDKWYYSNGTEFTEGAFFRCVLLMLEETPAYVKMFQGRGLES